jgi:hypothetical protein
MKLYTGKILGETMFEVRGEIKGASVRGPWTSNEKISNIFRATNKIHRVAQTGGPKKGVPPSRCGQNIEGPCPQLPPSIVSHDSALLLCLGPEVRGHVCAQLGPWSVEYFRLDPLIFSGLGR